MPRAFRVKEEILSAYPDATVTLHPKTGGFFDVIVEECVIFSKTDTIGTLTERFPQKGEIIALMHKAGY